MTLDPDAVKDEIRQSGGVHSSQGQFGLPARLAAGMVEVVGIDPAGQP